MESSDETTPCFARLATDAYRNGVQQQGNIIPLNLTYFGACFPVAIPAAWLRNRVYGRRHGADGRTRPKSADPLP